MIKLLAEGEAMVNKEEVDMVQLDVEEVNKVEVELVVEKQAYVVDISLAEVDAGRESATYPIMSNQLTLTKLPSLLCCEKRNGFCCRL